MFKTDRVVTHNGETKTLRAWAEEMNVPYGTLAYRWKMGYRTYDALFNGWQNNRFTIAKGLRLSESDIAYLRETKYARAGMPDEWEIACDLIGTSRSNADALRRMLA